MKTIDPKAKNARLQTGEKQTKVQEANANAEKMRGEGRGVEKPTQTRKPTIDKS